MGDLQTHLLHHSECSAIFYSKRHDPHDTIPPILPQVFLFPQMKEVSVEKHFADVEDAKQKTAGASEGIKIGEFKNCSEQWEKDLDRCLHQMESTWKVT